MRDETQPGALTWLHLSDLHVLGESWEQDHVLDALVRDLPELLADRGLRPELLFVTGDVAARGQREEYDGADIVLRRITERLGLERMHHVFLVPGNHDVERGRIKPMVQRDHATLLRLEPDDLRKTVGELLGDPEELSRYGKRLGEWCAFTERFLGVARSVSIDRPWRSDVVDVGGLRVGILSLCTAWASGPTDRQGSLILGERQLHDMLAEARDGGASLTIALMHHPLHWLNEREHSAIRGRLEREVDVVLHGHVHDTHSALFVAGGSPHIVLGAGAAYAELGQDRFHGFSVARLDATKGRLEVHHFTWTTRSGKWHGDSGASGADDRGCVSLLFSPARIASEEPRAAGTEVLATRLRRAAARAYATVDFAGLRAGGPRRHVTLEQIFVPLRMTATGLKEAKSSWFEPEEESSEEELFNESDDPDDLAEHDWVEYQRDLQEEFKDQFPRKIGLHGLEAMLEAGRKIVVRGGPGSGKSTLTKYIARTTAERDGGRVPLLLPVRDWIAEGKREHLLDMAARQAGVSLSVRTDRGTLEALCERGNVLLIVDGVDEAADPAVRRELRSQLHSFVAAYPGVPVLVTSRIAGYHDVPLDDEIFDELTLEPFDDDSLEQFVRRWYDLVEDNPASRLLRREDLLHALEVEPRAKELARNPLLATLIGMVHFSHAQLPGDRAKLYGRIIELLLITWPAERKRELPELHGTAQQPMLEALALRLQEQRSPKNSLDLLLSRQQNVLVDVDSLESMLADLLASARPERGTAELQHLARMWSKWLVEGAGILQEQQPGHVVFLHLSLMEYMAGRALLERNLRNGHEAVAAIVKERFLDAPWMETLLLMLGSENKNRALGTIVINRLLESEDKGTEWQLCEFGLALLREDVDVGEARERLLAKTCHAVLETGVEVWGHGLDFFTDLVQFSRTHGHGIREWLRSEITGGASERWIGALVLATNAFSEGEVVAWVEARRDRAATVLTLLDLGAYESFGRWARQNCTREIALVWARSTPIEGALWRSFEGIGAGAGAEWIPALLTRSGWMARLSVLAAERLRQVEFADGRSGLPAGVMWVVGEEVQGTSRLCPGWYLQRSGENSALRFSREFAEELAREFAGGFSRRVAKESAKHIATDAVRQFTRDLAFYASATLRKYFEIEPSYFGTSVARSFADDYAMFSAGHPTDFMKKASRRFNHAIVPRLRARGSYHKASSTPSALWAQLRTAVSIDEALVPASKLLVVPSAETHAAFLLVHDIEQPDVSSTLAVVRLQDRWLSLFFTPLVDYATKIRPLPEHPALHALLLTYGLIQYQTTWEWPDCPHWRSWFAAGPPTHWLPAHVWHLVRSIQDPTDPTHREHASAALDRNDWPELAQALRDTTVVPTPPEILALFDHGEGAPEPG